MKKGYHKTKEGKIAKKGLWYNIAQKRKAGKRKLIIRKEKNIISYLLPC